jgi:hypothetical protein
MLKIYYVIALNAPEMVMWLGARVKTFRFAVSLNYRNNSNLRKGQEGSVDRIKGDVGKDLPDLAEYGTGTGVVF